MSWTRDFLAGIAQHLETATTDTDDPLSWLEDGAYPADQTGIYMIGMPASPDRAVALTHYDVDATLYGHGTQGLQVRCRGTKDPRTAQDMADAVFDALHGAGPLDLASGIHLAKAWRQSHAPIGTDSSSRWETSSNFYVITPRPQSHLD